MKSLILIRHPATALAGTFCGHSDPDLSPVGKSQLTQLRRRLQGVRLDRILSSDLLRAQRCANELAHQHSVPVELRPGLREIAFGAWEGLNWSQIEAHYPAEAIDWLEGFPTVTPPQGEDYTHFAGRIRREAAGWSSLFTPNPLAVVTHRGVLQFILQVYGGIEAARAWEMTSQPATALFCDWVDGAECTLRIHEQWFAHAGEIPPTPATQQIR